LIARRSAQGPDARSCRYSSSGSRPETSGESRVVELLTGPNHPVQLATSRRGSCGDGSRRADRAAASAIEESADGPAGEAGPGTARGCGKIRIDMMLPGNRPNGVLMSRSNQRAVHLEAQSRSAAAHGPGWSAVRDEAFQCKSIDSARWAAAPRALNRHEFHVRVAGLHTTPADHVGDRRPL